MHMDRVRGLLRWPTLLVRKVRAPRRSARGATHLLYETSMTTILIDKNIMLPMRDGVRLATDVYRLAGAAPAPVLLTRTPYNKEQTVVGGGGVAFDVLRAVQAGYAV